MDGGDALVMIESRNSSCYFLSTSVAIVAIVASNFIFRKLDSDDDYPNSTTKYDFLQN